MSFSFNKEIVCYALGPTNGKGNELTQWVMKGNGNVVPRQTLRLLNVAEMHKTLPADWDPYEEYDDDDEFARSPPEVEGTVNSNDILIDQQQAYERIINAEVQLHHEDNLTTGKVKRRVLGHSNTTTGSWYDNPMLNSIVYEVEFPDKE
eukprot:15365069-Ditylum_brightwellii.AAC.2